MSIAPRLRNSCLHFSNKYNSYSIFQSHRMDSFRNSHFSKLLWYFPPKPTAIAVLASILHLMWTITFHNIQRVISSACSNKLQGTLPRHYILRHEAVCLYQQNFLYPALCSVHLWFGTLRILFQSYLATPSKYVLVMAYSSFGIKFLFSFSRSSTFPVS